MNTNAVRLAAEHGDHGDHVTSEERRGLLEGWLGGNRRPQRDLAVALGVSLARNSAGDALRARSLRRRTIFDKIDYCMQWSIAPHSTLYWGLFFCGADS